MQPSEAGGERELRVLSKKVYDLISRMTMSVAVHELLFPEPTCASSPFYATMPATWMKPALCRDIGGAWIGGNLSLGGGEHDQIESGSGDQSPPRRTSPAQPFSSTPPLQEKEECGA